MRVSGCCCCFSLRTGTLILGYLGAILYAVACIGIGTSIPNIRKLVNESEETDKDLTPEEFEELVTWTRVFAIIKLILTLGRFLLCALLLIGVYKEKPKLIKLFLIFQIIGVIFDLIPAIIILIGCFANTKLIGAFVEEIFFIGLHVYFITVIHSFRMELIENGGNKRGGANLPLRQA